MTSTTIDVETAVMIAVTIAATTTEMIAVTIAATTIEMIAVHRSLPVVPTTDSPTHGTPELNFSAGNVAKSAILQTNALPLLATLAIVPGKASTLLAVTQAPTALIDLLPQGVEDQALATAPQEIDQGIQL